MRILCLTDFPIEPPGHRWIWQHVPERDDEVCFLWAEARDRSARWGKLLTRYPSYFRLAFQALRRMSREPYDLVVAWEGKLGVPLAFLRRLVRRVRPPMVILAFAPGYMPRAFRPFVRIALRGVDHVTVLSQAERASYERLFGVPQAKMTVCRLGTYDRHDDARQSSGPNLPPGPYIHSSGRTARDFSTLVEAVRGLDVRLILHGRRYDLDHLDIPPNVQVGELVPMDQYDQLVLHSLFEVVPLRGDVIHPAGSSQIVMAMMMCKPVVATYTPILAEYVEHGVTGLLVEPGNVAAMRSAILYLLEHPYDTMRMGALARQRYEEQYTFDRFARSTCDILERIAMP